MRSAAFPATKAGYRRLLRWGGALAGGTVTAGGVEGTGSYGAGLTRFLVSGGIRVFEVDHPNRRHRSAFGESDATDAGAGARAVFFGKKGEVRKRYREGQEDQLGALGLVVNAVSLWNTRYVGLALEALAKEGFEARAEDVERLSPLRHEHVNLLGRYQFSLPEELSRGATRPLREPGAWDEY